MRELINKSLKGVSGLICLWSFHYFAAKIVGSDIHATMKPRTDNRVAMRMVGAALGVRAPVAATKNISYEKDAKIVDAWDD